MLTIAQIIRRLFRVFSNDADDQERYRLEFRIGDAFDPNDKMARYLVRLSMALGDLRVVATYVGREQQPSFERIYFVRLMASHLHELCVLFNAPREAIPSIDEFIAAVIEPDNATAAEKLRKSHKRIRQLLQQKVKVPGRPTLGSELKRLRNDLFHYFNNVADEQRLIHAIGKAAEIDSSYVIREKTMRANYSDEIATHLMSPWDLTGDEWEQAIRALHEAIIRLLDPITKFLHEAEAAYLFSRPAGTVAQIDNR